jgi:hypothetical protein
VRLFEFEQLDEGIARVKNIKKICVLINDHVYEQMKIRPKITEQVLEELINRIPDIRNKFRPLGENTSFKLWSKSLRLGLIIRKRLDKDKYQRVEVITVLDKPLFDNVNDIVFLVG